MPLPDDILRWTADRFAGPDLERVRALLSDLADDLPSESHRVLRCVLWLAESDVDLVVHFAEPARRDPRDVMYWTEYGEDDGRVRDLSRPFPDADPA
jgi:hypothetical protein